MIRALSPSPLLSRARRHFGRFLRAKAGIAVVEFAFILPLMLVLYFGLALLGQGLEIGRKVQLASRTLADLTAQTLPSSVTGTAGTGLCASVTTTPCILDSDLNNFWQGAQLVMTPFGSGNMTATLSLVTFDNVSTSNTGCCRARVVWSAGFGANASTSTIRACGLLNSSANGTNGLTLMPKGNYPLNASSGGGGDAITDGSYYVASGNTTDYYVVVADVTYAFNPGYDFNMFNWGNSQGKTYTISQTTYMTPRNGSTSTITWNSANGITPSNTSCNPNNP